MARSKFKPRTPDQIAADKLAKRAKDLEAVNLPPEASTLPQHQAIEITRAGEKREGQKVEANSARRLDAFSALKDGMAVGAYDAARRFERDVMLRRGEADRGAGGERLDKTAGLITDAMLDAGYRVDEVARHLTDREWWLLSDLIAPAVDRGSWRSVVGFVTGIEDREEQETAVRDLCVKLLWIYATMDRRQAA